MSQISLSGNAGGSGTFTIASPNSNNSRTLTLPDATGTLNTSGAANEVPAGSAAAPAIYPTGDTNTGIFFPAADTIAFTEGGVESMRIDTSGNVGIGIPAFSTTKLLVKNSTNNNIGFINSATYGSNAVVGITDAGAENALGLAGSTLCFYTSASERARINSSGNLLVGTTNTGSGERLIVAQTSADAAIRIANFTSGNAVLTLAAEGLDAGAVFFERSTSRLYVRNSLSGGVYLASNATSWTAVSDERNKDIIEPITGAANKVSALRAVIGKYKTDDNKVRRSFLIAQDVQKVLPEAVDTSNPDSLGVRYTDVVPLLVAAIQELNAKVEALELQLKGA